MMIIFRSSSECPTPETVLDHVADDVVQLFGKKSVAVANEAANEAMAVIGKAISLPSLTWVFNIDKNRISGQAPQHIYDKAAALEALVQWADALHLARQDTAANGTVEYSGDTVFGIKVEVWAVIDRVRFNA